MTIDDLDYFEITPSLSEAIKGSKYTYQEIGDLIGVKKAMINKYVNGHARPNRTRLKQLADILEIDFSAKGEIHIKHEKKVEKD